jgi:acyl-coenzyme A thioesterase PaaI-like protein
MGERTPLPDLPVPNWYTEIALSTLAKPVVIKEWQDEDWRVNEGGFSGYDFCHSKRASVRILDYVMLLPGSVSVAEEVAASSTKITPGTLFPSLVGVAHFTPLAESHRGLCHGGSFCALMDDVIGWLGFCTTGEVLPWSGYTVQVNTSLRKAVKVGSVLKLEAWVDRKEGERKYWILAKLSDGVTGEVYCDGSGLFLQSKDKE